MFTYNSYKQSPQEEWDLFRVDKDGQEHYLGRWIGWHLWSHVPGKDLSPIPIPTFLYVTDEGVPETTPIYSTRMRRRKELI